MHNRRSSPRAAARCVVMVACAVSMAIAVATAFSACSVDLLKPESYAFIKDAIAATPVPGESPGVAGTPSARSTPSRLVNASPLQPSDPSQPWQPVPLPPPPPGAINPSREARVVPASDAPGGFSLPLL